MKVYYFNDEIINEDALHAGLTLAVQLSKDYGEQLSIFVNVISGPATDQFINKLFKQVDANKLRSGKTIVAQEVNVKLESQKTFNEYKNYEVILGLHVSNDILAKIEKNESVKHLVILVETQDINMEWIKKVNAKKLTFK